MQTFWGAQDPYVEPMVSLDPNGKELGCSGTPNLREPPMQNPSIRGMAFPGPPCRRYGVPRTPNCVTSPTPGLWVPLYGVAETLGTGVPKTPM